MGEVLRKTVIHIIPLFDRDSVGLATADDCSGGTYGGPRYDDKFSTEQVGNLGPILKYEYMD